MLSKRWIRRIRRIRGGGVLEYNAICENNLRVQEKIEEITLISSSSLADPPDPNSEVLTSNEFSADQELGKEVSDLPDPPDPLDPLLVVVDHRSEWGDAEASASILLIEAPAIFENPQMLDELVEDWSEEFKHEVWKFLPSDLQQDYRALKESRNATSLAQSVSAELPLTESCLADPWAD